MVEQNRGFFTFLILYRWVNWLLAAVLLYLQATPETTTTTLIAVYGSAFFYNLMFTVWPSRIERAMRRYPWLLAGDVVFCSLLIMAYGWRSPFWIYSLSPVMLGGYMFRAWGGFISAALMAGGYGLAVSLTGYTWSELDGRGFIDSHLFHFFDYFLVAIFFTYPAVLADRLRRSNAELREAQLKIERLVLDKERQRIASEIHDGVTQSLMGLNLLVEDALKKSTEEPVIERLGLAQEAAAKAINQTRLAIDDLFEERLSYRRLSELADDVFGDLGRVHNIQASLAVEGEEVEIPVDIKKALYMILQEVVGNVVKHAGATRIEAKLRFNAGDLELSVSDDGSGFDVDRAATGYGLTTISNRVSEIRGTFELDSLAGRGTNVLICVPLLAGAVPKSFS